MTSATVTVQLGRVGPPTRDETDRRGRLLYLPDRDLIVVPQDRRPGGWTCAVIGGRAPAAGRITLATTDIDAAEATLTIAPGEELARFVLLWRARVWQRWGGRRTAQIARTLVQHARPAGTLTIALTPAAVGNVSKAARVRAPGLRAVLDRLVNAGMLTPRATAAGGTGYVLTLPCLPGRR